ncbi:MAG: hypothetical protein OEZ13_13835 [Spirochaetia bacterium]|nr:hypothetical protein [Spirochaetia bacterium]
MITDTDLRKQGMNVLIKNLGLVEAEKFISLIRSEHFNYTKWQKNLWADKTVDEIYDKAKEYYDNQKKNQ